MNKFKTENILGIMNTIKIILYLTNHKIYPKNLLSYIQSKIVMGITLNRGLIERNFLTQIWKN